ncbi:hypothetical protein EXIGLDRAFT_766588 [Exidia glandulosa HHB12029]|uniref:IPT/TIG domain-containing protein n=1 Tax=Exidia glandulosa HHB12029 TaxID=1314781 RepID=A0A165JKX0_EXIGL|nr:hypothetical protein EXIGLDRAFT_766588 [Exidia glandulosa HHB12029]
MSSTSRSSSPFHSSPATPESGQANDFMGDPTVAVAGWETSSGGAQTLSEIVDWVAKDVFGSQQQADVDGLLSLDDLLQEDAFAESSNLMDDSQPIQRDGAQNAPYSCSPASLHEPAPAARGNPNAAKAAQHREDSPLGSSVSPPKEACQDLLIVFPNLPASGAKSRVETQIRTEVVLSNIPNIPATFPPANYESWDRVASWKWLRLPRGASTKKRSRKDAKIAPAQEDVLDLSVDVICLSNPEVPVSCCESCQQREAKRTARKIAARVRPTKVEPTDDSLSDNEAKIVQFNCPELVDFSSGMCALPVRITCYCRHHREKVGFSVIFTMRDSDGRVVGSGSTPPIMITDDHKSASLAKTKEAQQHPHQRRSLSAEEDGAGEGAVRGLQRHDIKKRPPKPYDRKQRVASGSSSAGGVAPISTFFPTAPPSPTTSPSMANTHAFASPTDPSLFSTISSASTSLQQPYVGLAAPGPIAGSSFTSPTPIATPQRSPSPASAYPPFPLLFGLPQAPPPFSSQQPLPKIHRLIPASGPTHGGIEITVLGSGFTSAALSCVFGGTRATSTQIWSENTLVCLLPPRSTPGQVAVTVERLDDGVTSEEHDGTASNVFTYVDDSDRALMELALQVVGLKMTGKIEEAKNVALRIVGSTGNGTGMESEASGMTTLASDAPDPRLLLLQLGRITDLQGAIVNLLSSYFPAPDASAPSGTSSRSPLSHKASSGQTLLHLATILNMTSLVAWLINRGIEIDAQDRNGFTALHFAVLAGSRDCAATLFRAGADRTKRTRSGHTPAQLAGDWVSNLLVTPSREASVASEDLADEEWPSEDESEDDDIRSLSDGFSSPTIVPQSPSPSSMTRRRRPHVTSGSETSDGEQSDELQSPPPSAPPTPGTDEKQAFAGWLGRKLAQHLQPPQGTWGDWTGALPQIPVFYVVPSWPWSPPADDDEKRRPGAESQKPQPIPSSWEKWTAQMLTSPRAAFTLPARVQQQQQQAVEQQQQQQQHTYPPMPAGAPANAERSRMYARIARSMGYTPAPVGDAEINSYGALEVKARRSAKQDRMLLWFWVPILLLGLAWVLYTGVPVAYKTVYRSVRTFLPLRDVLPV